MTHYVLGGTQTFIVRLLKKVCVTSLRFKYFFVHLFVWDAFVYLSIFISIHLSIYLSIYLPIYARIPSIIKITR